MESDLLPSSRDRRKGGDALDPSDGELGGAVLADRPAAAVHSAELLPRDSARAAVPGTRAKHWLLTCFDRAEWQQFKQLRELGARYWAFQEEEAPETGRRHIQAYLGFEKQVSFEFIKRQFPSAHAEMANWPVACFRYCCKPETRVGDSEFRGCTEPPSYRVGNGGGEPGGDPAPKKERKLDRVLRAIKLGVLWDELLEQFPTEYAEAPSVIHRLFEMHRFKLYSKPGAWDPPVCAIFYGPPGTGKSSSARMMFETENLDFFKMTIGKWADGYAYQRGILIDDMSPFLVPRAQLLNLMETGLVNWEIKGGTVMLAAKMVIITSNYAPEDWFPVRQGHKDDDELSRARADALLRRAAVFRCDYKGTTKVEPSKFHRFSRERSDFAGTFPCESTYLLTFLHVILELTCKKATVEANQKSILNFFKSGIVPVVAEPEEEQAPPSPVPASSSSSAPAAGQSDGPLCRLPPPSRDGYEKMKKALPSTSYTDYNQ